MSQYYALKTSADFGLITNAGSVTGYVAPIGAETVYTEDADIDPVNVANSVRAAIIVAGTTNENTDITALIANNSFELGNTLGWTTVASDDTGARAIGESGSTYYTSGADGNYLFNTWSKGTPITQTIGTLPAGQYTLTAKVASNGATVYLTMNDTYNSGAITSDAAVFVDNSYTFTLGSATVVTIGLVGGDGSGNYLAEGYWWYKADKFTLTYNGVDPLEQAKATLNDEIEVATLLMNNWIPKVGTAPFKYESTYFDDLVSKISMATITFNSGSTRVSDYTTALSNLQTAETNMSNSTQNTPNADKYYRIFVATGNTASNYNLNLSKASRELAKVTAVPYPVQIIADGTTGRYYINDPYGNHITVTTTSNYAATTYHSENQRSQSIRITLNDNGTVNLDGYRGGSIGYVRYSGNATEGSSITALQTNTGTWVISDAVDVTEVNLGVNATAGWGTFIAPFDDVIPSSVKAYTISHKNGNTIFLEENTSGVLNANAPYILSTNETNNVSKTLIGIANNTQNSYTENGLVGLINAGTIPTNSYVLQYQEEVDGTAFYKTTSDIEGRANRCYLNLETVSIEAPSGARSFIAFKVVNEEETTGISTIGTHQQSADYIYNLRGQRISLPTGGLYIVNGKKVIKK